MGLDGYSSQHIFFLSPNFCCLPLFVFPTGGQLCVVLCTRPWPFLLPCGFFVFCVLSLCFLPLHSYFLSSLALSTSCYLSPSLTPSLNLSLSLSVSLRSLSLSLFSQSFLISLPPSLPLTISHHAHTLTSFSHSDAHILTLLQCLIFSLFHGLPFPAHWWKMSSTLLTHWRYTAQSLHSGVFHSIIEALLWDGQPIISRR